MTAAADDGATRHGERRAMSVASGAHALHDGYTDLIYIMLPVWQAEFGLSYAAIGLLRGLYAGTMALLQMTAARLSRRYGAAAVLAGGTGLAGFGYCLAGFSGSFAVVLVALIVGGIGASAQHPIAPAMVAHAFSGPRSMKAMGGYNFAGDIGKMTAGAGGADAHHHAVATDAHHSGVNGSCRGAADLPAGAKTADRGRTDIVCAGSLVTVRGTAGDAGRVSHADVHRHHRQRHPHGLSHLSAVHPWHRRAPAFRWSVWH
jgi:hypothetical protein